MKPVKMWAVFNDRDVMILSTIKRTRYDAKVAFSSLTDYFDSYWHDQRGYRIRRVTVFPAPQTKGDDGE